MKNILYVAIAFIAILNTSSVFAQQDIGVINMKRVLDESKAHQDLTKQMNQKGSEYGSKMENDRNILQQKAKDLIEKKSILSESEYKKSEKALEQEGMMHQEQVYKSQMIFEKAYTDSMSKLNAEIVKIVNAEAQNLKMQLVLTDGGVVDSPMLHNKILYYYKKLDITDKVIRVLNNKMTSLSPEFPAEDSKSSKVDAKQIANKKKGS